MKGRGLEIRVGAVVLLAAVVLVVGTMWFQRFAVAEKRYSFFARFKDVGGLIAGDPIFINGVERGKVKKVDLQLNLVVVEMAVRQGVAVPRDSKVSLQAVGIMGERNVTIMRGASPQAIAPGDTVDGELLMGLGEVMGRTGEIIDEVDAAIENLRDVTEALNRDGKLKEGIADFAATGKSARQMTEENRVRINRTLDNLDRSTAQLSKLLDSHYADIDTSLTAFGKAGREVQNTVAHLTEISDNLKKISTNLKDGKGSAGRLLTDQTLVLRMESATASLDTLLKDMKAHPNKYVKFSLF
jgi:phospholipid/cholesterol/gamma-HCH transport system substrate-binding protein